MRVCIACGTRFNSSGWECPSCHVTPKLIAGYLAFSPELAEDSRGFKASYFAQLANIEVDNFWFRARSRLLIWALHHYFPSAEKFFEIGCGTGFVLSGIENALPQLSLYGSEIYAEGLTYASRRLKKTQLFQMDARHIPFQNEFDIVGIFDVLEHIEDDELVLSQMYKAVCQGGGIILTVPQHRFLWSQIDEHACHVRRYNAKELKTKVEKAGFKVLRMTSFISLLLPFMLIVRLMKRNANRQYDMFSELKISGLTNTILEKVLNFELSLIRRSFYFPMGGSLLIIAKKNS